MRFIAMLILAVALVSSCQAKPKATAVVASSGPNLIAELTDQKVIYNCPQCGMDFDAAGTCSMDSTALVQTDVAYICPADDKPVEHAGSCPRCPVNAKVVRTSVAATTPEEPATPATGAPSGS